MPRTVRWIAIFGLLAIALGGIVVMVIYQHQGQNTFLPSATTMRLSSSAFHDSELLPARYTCDGENISPPLDIHDVPAGAVTLALVVDDPDAPRGNWVHWLVWNIDPATVTIREHAVSAGAVQGTTDFGTPGYGGPCPPSGTHRYLFKLYALDVRLDLPTAIRKPQLEQAMAGHILGQTVLVGQYRRLSPKGKTL